MKAYKCPKCGYLNEIIGTYGESLRNCPDCNFDFTKDVVKEEVEIIDWEKELITETK